MAKLNEYVKEMEVKEFKNIEDFESIPVDIEVVERTIEKKEVKDGEEPTFNIFEATIEGVQVRVPKQVLNQLKTLFENSDMTSFKVVKSGSGLNTNYQVVPQ